MTFWDDFHVTQKILAILEAAPVRTPGHHFGRPWLTTYQITTALEEQYPEAYAALADLTVRISGSLVSCRRGSRTIPTFRSRALISPPPGSTP